MREEDMIAAAEDAGFAKAAVMNTEDLEFEHEFRVFCDRMTAEITEITMDVLLTAERPGKWRTGSCSTKKQWFSSPGHR